MATNTGNPYVDALAAEAPWADALNLDVFLESGDGGAWTMQEQNLFINALQSWSAVANIGFTIRSTRDGAELVERKEADSTWPDDDPTPNADHAGPGGTSIGRYNSSKPQWTPADLMVGGTVHSTFVHELGHAFGLDHPHPDPDADALNFPGVTADNDQGDNNLNRRIFTVMSYNRDTDPAENNYGHVATPMAFDIAAIQELYGANMGSNSGDTTYTLPDNNAAGTFYSCIWDVSGTDQIVYAGARDATIDLRPATLLNAPGGGGFVSRASNIDGGFTIAADFTGALANSGAETGVIIENATGGQGKDTITGNAAANTLSGNGGADTLTGNDGNDRFEGGTGGDTLNGGNGIDQAQYTFATSGVTVDLISPSANTGEATSDTFISIENLRGTNFNDVLRGDDNSNTIGGLGGGGFDTLEGRGGADYLAGGDGNDGLHGGTGADTLEGGTGDDTYYLDDALGIDTLIENAGGGHDTAQATVNWVLGANFEDLVLAGSANINGYGNGVNNRITGNSGHNYLLGSAGADTLLGGGGNDYYELDDLTFVSTFASFQYDSVTESAGAGIDTVRVTAIDDPDTIFGTDGYTLGANIENGVIAGTLAFNLTGNTLANQLTGNSHVNILTGGEGGDTYFLTSLAQSNAAALWAYDTVAEAGGGGADSVVVTAADNPDTIFGTDGYTLGATIENGVIAGSLAFNLTGNALANALTGNSHVNVLTGGDGGDTYYLTSLAQSNAAALWAYDTVAEAGGAGADSVVVTAADNPDTVFGTDGYILGANIENGVIAGTLAFNLTGNALANALTGNGNVNLLTGGEGGDTYYLTSLARLNAAALWAFDTVVETGGTGTDSVVVTAEDNPDTVFGTDGYTLGASIENGVIAGTLAFNLTGNSIANRLQGNGAVNALYGGLGNDSVYGGLGNDRVEGGDGGDSWLGGDAGLDTIYGGLGNDRIDGGADGDTWLGGDAGLDYITGGDGDDRIDGGADGDTWLGGGGGADYITGGDGNDRVDGGSGNNTWLGGGAGGDYITGGDGDDRADGGSEADNINGGAGRDTITGGGGDDTITGGGEAGLGDIINGDAGIDYIYGGLGDDRIDGGADGDSLNGEDGLDNLTGGLGVDWINGGAGADYMEGGDGNDRLTGGAAADTFDFNVGTDYDSVTDFTNDVDTLRIDPGFGFANVAAVLASTIQSGNHARVLLNAAGTDSVYLLNYLTPGNGNTIANLGDDILIA